MAVLDEHNVQNDTYRAAADTRIAHLSYLVRYSVGRSLVQVELLIQQNKTLLLVKVTLAPLWAFMRAFIMFFFSHFDWLLLSRARSGAVGWFAICNLTEATKL